MKNASFFENYWFSCKANDEPKIVAFCDDIWVTNRKNRKNELENFIFLGHSMVDAAFKEERYVDSL